MNTVEATWDRWLEHPVVRLARDNVPRSASALDLLTETMRLLNEIDERFPGLPMADVLSAPTLTPAQRRKLRARLVAAGAHPANVVTLAPSAVELAMSDSSYTEISERWGESLANFALTLRKPPTPAESEAASLVLDENVSMSDAAAALGRGLNWVKRAVDRARFRLAQEATVA